MASIYTKLEKLLKQAKDPSWHAYTWRHKSDPKSTPVAVDEVKRKLRGLEYRRESDGAITLISDKLEITVRRR